MFVFPSRTDTFGLVMLEALACGVPVAAYPVQGRATWWAMRPSPLSTTICGRACLRALEIPREAARAFALTRSWRACTEQFLSNLPVRVPRGIRREADSEPSGSRAGIEVRILTAARLSRASRYPAQARGEFSWRLASGAKLAFEIAARSPRRMLSFLATPRPPISASLHDFSTSPPARAYGSRPPNGCFSASSILVWAVFVVVRGKDTPGTSATTTGTSLTPSCTGAWASTWRWRTRRRYYNPLLDIPFYLAGDASHAWIALGMLGAVQGANVVPLYLIARAMFRIAERKSDRRVLSLIWHDRRLTLYLPAPPITTM